MEGKECIRLQKGIFCCGKSFLAEIATEMSLDSLSLSLECPSCGKKHYVSLDSFIKNRAVQSSSSPASSSSSPGENPLSFMETPQEQSLQSSSEGEKEQPRPYDVGEPSPLEELFDEGL